MAEIYLTKTVNGLSPADDAAREILRKIKLGKVVKAEVVQPRNLRHHRKFFGLLNLVWQAAGDWASVEDLLIELKIKLGITKDVVIKDSGEVFKVVGSISFAAMNQHAFDEFYERALQALCELAGGIESDMLREEVLRQVAA
jgi:hypothetical protein